ncbi:MAG: penicillin-binding protein 2 [Nitrosomonadales bacterium]|nr:penicillin-binding protein 2 [Nitrosomonadales bacterium]
MRSKIKKNHEFFELSKFRRRFTLLVLLTLFCILFSRAFFLQGMQKDFLQQEGFERSNRNIELYAYRGKIYDRNNQILAASETVRSITLEPNRVEFKKGDKKKLANLLEMKIQTLNKKLKIKRNHIYLKRKVDPKIASKILALKIPGISSEKDYRRTYPDQEISAHVVGYAGNDGNGLEGVEYKKNDLLSGTHGYKKILIDARRRVVENLSEVNVPIDGKDVHLTIDKRLQHIAFQSLKKTIDDSEAISGSAILIDSKTGEILTMVNYPSYNPNKRMRKRTFVRNRVVTDMFEPGSTMKPISIAAALEKKVVNVNTKIDTGNGFYKVGRTLVTDTKPHGIISVKEILQTSSNIGVTKIAEKLSKKDLWQTYSNFGIGNLTGLNFPGESKGIIRDYKKWRDRDHYSVSYGYSVSTTIAQLARAYTPFANKGEIKNLRLFKNDPIKIGQRVMSIETTKAVLKMMESVTKEGGTATQAAIPGYRVAGKTGTSRQFIEGKGYGAPGERKYNASFVGIAPISNPKFIMAIVIEDPTKGSNYGGVVAGPVFRKVVAEALKIYSIPQDGIEILDRADEDEKKEI